MTDPEFMADAQTVIRLADSIRRGTNHQIRQLQIVRQDGRLHIMGRVPSFYRKQQALQAVLSNLGPRIDLAQFLVEVNDSEARQNEARSVTDALEAVG